MLSLILSGVLVSLTTEIIKRKNQYDKAMTLWTLVILAVVVALLAHFIMDYYFWTSFGWIMIFAGAFYAYVLRNISAPVTKKKK